MRFLAAVGAWSARRRWSRVWRWRWRTRRLFEEGAAARLGLKASDGPDGVFGLLATFKGMWVGASRANAAADARSAGGVACKVQEEQRAAAGAPRREGRWERRRRRRRAVVALAAAATAARRRRRVAPVAAARAAARSRVRLPTNKKIRRRGAAAVAGGGGGRTCKDCGKPFLGWGGTCAKCRRGTGRKSTAVAPTGDACAACGKRVYAAERLVAGGRLFHRKSPGHPGCFNCDYCQVVLKAENFSCAGTKCVMWHGQRGEHHSLPPHPAPPALSGSTATPTSSSCSPSKETTSLPKRSRQARRRAAAAGCKRRRRRGRRPASRARRHASRTPPPSVASARAVRR